jgi:hypothetical protein
MKRVPRLKQGRPPKNVHGGRLLSLKEHGVDDRHIASRAIKVAEIPEDVFRRYLETEGEPTEKGLHRFASLKGGHEHGYFLTPPDYQEKIKSEFGDLWDACPFPRDPDFDCLKMEWPERVYVNAPWFGNFMDFIKKSVEQIKPGGVIFIVAPTRPTVNFLLEANGVNGVTVEMRSARRVRWLHTLTGKPAPSPPPITEIILRRVSATVPAAANAGIWHQHPEEIAERLVAADREKAAEVWRALGAQLGLSNQKSKQEAYKGMVLAYMARLNYPVP